MVCESMKKYLVTAKQIFFQKHFFTKTEKQWILRSFYISSNPSLFENFIDFCDIYFVMTKKVYKEDHKDTI